VGDRTPRGRTLPTTPTRFTVADATQSLTAGRTAKTLRRRTGLRDKERVATGSVAGLAGKICGTFRCALALARRGGSWRRRGSGTALLTLLAIAAALFLTLVPALVCSAVATAGVPAPGGLLARRAAITALGAPGPEEAFAPLEQTTAASAAATKDLRRPHTGPILCGAQGRVNSRRSSFGAEVRTRLRGVFYR
jgi:hypothetical protein